MRSWECQPELLVPGKPLFYTTAFLRGGYAYGVPAESHMGRPTKREGNAQHPASLGATNAYTQASPVQLYDPDRSQSLRFLGFDSAAAVCYTLLRRGRLEDYLSVAVLVGLVTFTVISIGGPFLFAYLADVPLAGVCWFAFLAAFTGLDLGLIVAWMILRLGRGRGESR